MQYIATIKPDMITAIIPKNLYAGTLYGLGISGSFFLKIMNERATMQYATQQPKLPASLIHTSIFLPAKGASIVSIPIRISAFTGVLYFVCSLAKNLGIIYDSAIEYIAREPPRRNEFHDVTIPHIPPTIITLAIILVLNAAAIASAVTSPVAFCESLIACGFITKPTAMIISA